jgi:hypothetical protein
VVDYTGKSIHYELGVQVLDFGLAKIVNPGAPVISCDPSSTRWNGHFAGQL